MSGVSVSERTIEQDGRIVKLYVMTPQRLTGKPGVLLFVHGGRLDRRQLPEPPAAAA
jgi:hypothetical protein